MPSPYRQSGNALPAPLPELRWRRRVGKAAVGAVIFLAVNIGLLVATWVLSLSWVLPGVVAWFVAGIGATATVWIATSGRVDAGLWGWLFRGGMAAYVVVLGLLLLGAHVETASLVVGALLVAADLTYLTRFAPSLATPTRDHGANAWLLSEVAFLISTLLLLAGMIRLWRLAAVFVLFLTVGTFEVLRQALLAVDHQWWFDGEMEPPGEWVSLLVHRDKHAEVLCVDETLGWFDSEDDATKWLKGNGYLPAQRAVRAGLVSEAPPVLLKARVRKRGSLNITSSRARVRVGPAGSDGGVDDAADQTTDEMDETTALDDAELQRAVAVHDPHDPRN